MCIRDSDERAAGAEGPTGQLLGRDDHADVVAVGARREAAAVSYTHLRAHETVLDLVCRLLLEKKTRTGRSKAR